MARKLKMPAAGLFNEQPVAPPTVADQAAALLESADDSPESAEFWEGQADAAAEPEIADADVPACPSVEGDGAATEVAATDQPAEPLTADQPAAAEPVVPEPISENLEQRQAWHKAYDLYLQNFDQWNENVEAAKEKHTSAAIVQAELKEAHKLAKSLEDDALQSLMKLLANKPEEPKLADVLAASAREAATDSSSPGSSAPSPTPTADQPASSEPSPPANDSWRIVPITKLDLPEKLIERLQEDGLTTMGRLEDRRGEISEGKAKWPKGIGAAKITKIEDAVIDWLTKNRDQAVFAELQPGVGESGAAAEPAVAKEITAEWFSDAINARAVELDTGESGCLDEKLKDAGYWDLGYQTYENGGNLATCGLPPSPAQDDFIRGWLAAGQAEDSADATAELEEPPEGEEPELEAVGVGVDGPQLFDPDNI